MKMFSRRSFLGLMSVGILSFTPFSMCRKTQYICKKLFYEKDVPAREPYITVWIHGVSLFGKNTYDLGLNKVVDVKRNLTLRRVGSFLLDIHPDFFKDDNLYMFSWSGKMDLNECEKVARQLWESLDKVVANYKSVHNVSPKIRIITFSYGGNVALSMPKVINDDKFSVDELILIGYPVHQELCCAPCDKTFKRVFNLYSIGDTLQIFDPQAFACRTGSCPMFTTKRLCRCDKLIQTRVMLNGCASGHFYLISRRFLSMLPQVIKQLNDWLDEKQASGVQDSKNRYVLSLYSHYVRNFSVQK